MCVLPRVWSSNPAHCRRLGAVLQVAGHELRIHLQVVVVVAVAVGAHAQADVALGDICMPGRPRRPRARQLRLARLLLLRLQQACVRA